MNFNAKQNVSSLLEESMMVETWKQNQKEKIKMV
jgi:hypothetical protein